MKLINEQLIFQLSKHIATNGQVIFTRHARLRLKERNMLESDVYEILKNPIYVKKYNESDSFPDKTNYRIVGKFEWSAVICIEMQDDQIIVVTVID